MNSFKYKVTLIVPIYNMEAYLEKCLDSIVAQTIDKRELEVLLLDDGSSDNSAQIMGTYASKYPFFKEIHKDNEGLSKTRNRGIQMAQGKYIMYLDSDDTLSPETIKNVTDFFDRHYDEVDLVSYFQLIIRRDGTTAPHHRHIVLNETGVYDLTKIENAFCSQTNINICVKNMGDDNIFFDEDRSFRQEDQKYCTEILMKKNKLGYCAEGEYQYLKNDNSATNTWFYAYYLFEPAMRYWESLFDKVKDGPVPYYIQAMFLNDIGWKNKSDILLPYHYSDEELEKAKARVLALLNRVDDEVIMNHPNIIGLQRPYYILKKSNNDIKVICKEDEIYVNNRGKTILKKTGSFNLVVYRFRVENNKVLIKGDIRNQVFSYIDKPELQLLINGGESVVSLDLEESSYSYYRAKIKTSKVWAFEAEIELEKLRSLEFRVVIDGHSYVTRCTFGKKVPFGKRTKKIAREHMLISYNKPVFSFKKLSDREEKLFLAKQLLKYLKRDISACILRPQALNLKKGNEIWLYYDCKGVFQDNGYYQFEHDMQINDNIDRYYILNEENFAEAVKNYPEEYQNRIVKFGSKEHKKLFLACSKVITAYIEKNNYHPYEDDDEYQPLLDLFDFPKLYYLQHGVLHAHVPWKYSYDRLYVEKEIISTRFEEENLKANYGFTDKYLAKTGMPRYDFIDAKAKAAEPKRILFAPSWRNYLIGNAGGEWVATDNKILNSDYYNEIQALLNSKELGEMLEKEDLYIDFKLHPIFERYKHLFNIANKRIRFAEKKVTESDYSIFITDFSSFVYDFAYLKRPIIYFFPDYELFKSGMNFYRQLDMPVEDGLGELATSGKEAVDAIIRIIKNNYNPLEQYAAKLDNFFYYYDSSQRDRVYEEIANS